MQLTATLRQRDFADCAGASSRTIGQSCNTPNQVRGSTSAKIKKKPNRLATRGTNVTLEESMYQQLGVCAPPPSPLLSDSPEPGSFTMFTGHNCSDWIYIQACRAGTYTHMQPSKHDKRVSVSVWIVAFKRSFRMEAHKKKNMVDIQCNASMHPCTNSATNANVSILHPKLTATSRTFLKSGVPKRR